MTGRLRLSVSPRPFRLKLQGRLLLLCFGAALPILTVFALSLLDQLRLLQAEEQQARKAVLFALASNLDNWGARHFADIRQISDQSLSNAILGNNDFSHLANKSHLSEIYRLFPDGNLKAYYPAKEGFIKAAFDAKELYEIGKKQPRTTLFAASPITGKNVLLIIPNVDTRSLPFSKKGAAPSGKEKPNANLISKPVVKPTTKLKSKPKRARSSRHRLNRHQLTQRTKSEQSAHSVVPLVPSKISKENLSSSKLLIAIDAAVVEKILKENQQNIVDDLSSGLTTSKFALADSAKHIFPPLTEANHSPKSQMEKFVPSLGLYVIAYKASGVRLDNPLNAWLTQTLLLSLIALLGSSYLVYLASKHFTRQIKLLVKEVLSLGHGDFTQRLDVRSNDELGKLAKAVNKIASKMQLDQEHRLMEEKISQAIRQSLDLDQVLMSTVTELGRALEASRCCLALVDNSRTKDGQKKGLNQELIFDYVWCDEGKNGTALNNRSLAIEEDGVMSMIIEQGSILSLDTLDENGPTPLFENGRTAPEDWRSIRSLIACPITSAEGTIGLILIQQCDRLRSWTDKEIELVEVVTRQLTVAMQHAHLFYYTRNMAEQEMLINHIVRCVRGSLDLDTILNTVTRELCAAIGADRCQILQPDTTGPLVVSHEYHTDGLESTIGVNLYAQELDFNPGPTEAVFTRGNFLLGIDLEKLSLRSSDISAATVRKDQPYDPWLIAVISNCETDARTAAFKYFLLSSASKSLIVAPLLNKSRIIGLLVVHECSEPRTWRSGEVQLVAAIADQLALAVTQAALFAQVKYQAITDGLTGLYNHVYFQNRLSEEIRLSDRKGLPCSLLMLDLDLLKQINDKYGHPVGDAAIRQVASALKTLLRSGDTAARYGGEEFAVILPETSLLEAALIGDRLCTNIANSQVPGLGQVTISVGVASYPRQAKDAMELVNKADQALYQAKKSGRNQIWISESVSDKVFPAGELVPEFRVTRRLALASSRKQEPTKQTKAE